MEKAKIVALTATIAVLAAIAVAGAAYAQTASRQNWATNTGVYGQPPQTGGSVAGYSGTYGYPGYCSGFGGFGYGSAQSGYPFQFGIGMHGMGMGGFQR
jgi:hypothetical protein